MAKLEKECCLSRTLCKLLASLIPEYAYVEDKENLLVKADISKTTHPVVINNSIIVDNRNEKNQNAVYEGKNIDQEQKQNLFFDF